MSQMHVMNDRELDARFEVRNETYVKKLQIEARVLGDMVLNHIIPTAIRQQNMLLENVRGLKEVFDKEEYNSLAAPQLTALREISSYISGMRTQVRRLVDARIEANKVEDMAIRAKMYCTNVLPVMEQIRENADNLEMVVDDELWPLPKYRELLFFR